jgi:hypothetical protein
MKCETMCNTFGVSKNIEVAIKGQENYIKKTKKELIKKRKIKTKSR